MSPPAEQGSDNPASNPVTGLVDRQIQKALADLFAGAGGGTGSGGSSGLDARVAKLEAHTEHMQSDLTEIRTMLGGLGDTMRHLPTKQDLSSNVTNMVLIGLTVMVLAIGGIIGGLDFIQNHAPTAAAPAASAPLIFQLPAQAQAVPQTVAPAPRPAKSR